MQTTEQPAYGIDEAERPLWFGQTPGGWGDALRTSTRARPTTPRP